MTQVVTLASRPRSHLALTAVNRSIQNALIADLISSQTVYTCLRSFGSNFKKNKSLMDFWTVENGIATSLGSVQVGPFVAH